MKIKRNNKSEKIETLKSLKKEKSKLEREFERATSFEKCLVIKGKINQIEQTIEFKQQKVSQD